MNATLETKPGTIPPTMRERLAQHRTQSTCNSCHSVIDPLGFSLENFDVIGGWRTIDEAGKPVDASGTTASGMKIDGLSGLRAALLKDPEQFPRTVTEKLMAYALGRRLEYYDEPAVRKIVRDAAAKQYRWSSLIVGIVESPGFLMRTPAYAVQVKSVTRILAGYGGFRPVAALSDRWSSQNSRWQAQPRRARATSRRSQAGPLGHVVQPGQRRGLSAGHQGRER